MTKINDGYNNVHVWLKSSVWRRGGGEREIYRTIKKGHIQNIPTNTFI